MSVSDPWARLSTEEGAHGGRRARPHLQAEQALLHLQEAAPTQPTPHTHPALEQRHMQALHWQPSPHWHPASLHAQAQASALEQLVQFLPGAQQHASAQVAPFPDMMRSWLKLVQRPPA